METMSVLVLLLLASLSAAMPQAGGQTQPDASNSFPGLQKLIADVEFLKNNRAAEQVAFSAGLGPAFGPFDTNTYLVYNTVYTNIGNHYNKDTGIFTAPVRGLYHFEFFCAVDSGPGTIVNLEKNGVRVLAAQETQAQGFGSAGNAVYLELNQSDTVRLTLLKGHKIYAGDHSTFSGRLVFVQ